MLGKYQALLLLGALICIASVCGSPLQLPIPLYTPKVQSVAPVTVLPAFRNLSNLLANSLLAKNATAAYADYLKAVKKQGLADASRLTAFRLNLQKIVSITKSQKLPYTAGINRLTDLKLTERVKYLGLVRRNNTHRNNSVSKSVVLAQLRASSKVTVAQLEAHAAAISDVVSAAADHVSTMATKDFPNWTPALPDIKNQGQCGCCFAFAATALTEAAHYIATNEVINLSEKQVVDCDTVNSGCDGGLVEFALEYIQQRGLTSSALYPYTAQQTNCPAPLPGAVSKLLRYIPLPENDEIAMLKALSSGPLAVAMTVDDGFWQYSGGVYSSPTCGGEPNHAIVIVGAGVDSDTSQPYWLLRNSWGSEWGEGGYARLLRRVSGPPGPGMCNIASSPFLVASSDTKPAVVPAPPPIAPGCKNVMVTVYNTTSVKELAEKYGTTIAQIMLDNQLSPTKGLKNGRQLTINCPRGTWSKTVYGNWPGAAPNDMILLPAVLSCPPGTYAVQFYVKPSGWHINSVEGIVGQVQMTCSDGTVLIIDAIPGFTSGFADGTVTQPAGFTSIFLRSGYAIDSLYGVGSQTGGENSESCPQGTVVVGIAGGVSPQDGTYPTGWVSSLQFQCANPFTQDVKSTKLKSLLMSNAPKLRQRLSCTVYVATATDTWLSIANTKGLGLMQLMRSNPGITGPITAGTKVFVPPCNNGLLEGSTAGGASVDSARRADLLPGFLQAGVQVQRPAVIGGGGVAGDADSTNVATP